MSNSSSVGFSLILSKSERIVLFLAISLKATFSYQLFVRVIIERPNLSIPLFHSLFLSHSLTLSLSLWSKQAEWVLIVLRVI